MRQVKFKKWIPIETIKQVGTNNEQKVVGTGCWEKEFSRVGKFHQWGLAMEDTGETVASYSIGLIEDENGVVNEIIPSHLIFID
jgi:hypothetical protein